MRNYNEKEILLRKLKRFFPDKADRHDVVAILNEYGNEKHEQEPDRVRLAILKISDKTVESIRQNTALARRDFRDALVAAEYPHQSKKRAMPEGPKKQEIIDKDRLQYENWLFNDSMPSKSLDERKGRMKIIHKPTVGIELAGQFVPWGATRQGLQESWGVPSEAMNSVHEISKYLPDAEDIIERKDIYRNYMNQDIAFAAVYDEDDIFSEFELHEADQITIADVDIHFEAAVPDLVKELEQKGYDLTQLEGSNENILINALLTNFASSRHLGGDGDAVGYVYCSVNIDHLLLDDA